MTTEERNAVHLPTTAEVAALLDERRWVLVWQPNQPRIQAAATIVGIGPESAPLPEQTVYPGEGAGEALAALWAALQEEVTA